MGKSRVLVRNALCLAVGIAAGGCALARVRTGSIDAIVIGRATIVSCEPGASVEAGGSADGALLDTVGPCLVVSGGAFSGSWKDVATALGSLAAMLVSTGVIP